MKPAAIHVHIDELMLDGFDPHQRHAIADALERELAALIATESIRAVPSRALQRDDVDAGCFNIRQITPAAVAHDVARSLHHAVLNAVSEPPPPGGVARSP